MATASEILNKSLAVKKQSVEVKVKVPVEVAAPLAPATIITRTTQAAVGKTFSAPTTSTFTSRLPTVEIELVEGTTVKFVSGSYTTSKANEIAELVKLVARIPNNFARVN